MAEPKESPYRVMDPSKAIEVLDKRVGEVERQLGRSNFGQWLFRAAVVVTSVFVLFSIGLGVKSCVDEERREAKLHPHKVSATERQRRRDERACEALAGDYVQRIADSLVCNVRGDAVIVQAYQDERGNKLVKIVRQ